MTDISDLFDILGKLRHPESGCHWDRTRTIHDMLTPLKNETEEFFAAVETGDPEQMEEELGDVLWNVLFLMDLLHATHGIRPRQVMDRVKAKMIGRHPHVFGGQTADSPEAARASYKAAKDALKEKEKQKKAKRSKS